MLRNYRLKSCLLVLLSALRFFGLRVWAHHLWTGNVFAFSFMYFLAIWLFFKRLIDKLMRVDKLLMIGETWLVGVGCFKILSKFVKDFFDFFFVLNFEWQVWSLLFFFHLVFHLHDLILMFHSGQLSLQPLILGSAPFMYFGLHSLVFSKRVGIQRGRMIQAKITVFWLWTKQFALDVS